MEEEVMCREEKKREEDDKRGERMRRLVKFFYILNLDHTSNRTVTIESL
jgi:hypothetical protein